VVAVVTAVVEKKAPSVVVAAVMIVTMTMTMTMTMTSSLLPAQVSRVESHRLLNDSALVPPQPLRLLTATATATAAAGVPVL
jgi:hypothetical protein